MTGATRGAGEGEGRTPGDKQIQQEAETYKDNHGTEKIAHTFCYFCKYMWTRLGKVSKYKN